jgi:putative ABC transport system substrate-binding protein
MRRRGCLAWIGAAALGWPLAAEAQQPGRMRRVAILFGLPHDADGQARLTALRSALRNLRWEEGRNLRIDLRLAVGDNERTRAIVAELISTAPDVIFASPASMVTALRRQTWTIPIVFVQSGDPVRAGTVMSHARPGGNATGFTLFEASINTKYLQLLKDIAPAMTRVAVMENPDNTSWRGDLAQVEAAAQSLGVVPVLTPVRDAADVERQLAAFASQSNGGLIVPPDNTTLRHRGVILAAAARHRLPAVYSARVFVAEGGLMSYAIDQRDAYRRAASYVDRILQGEKPGELPVQGPVKFDLTINLKTAKLLGLDVPLAMLARADEVIE